LYRGAQIIRFDTLHVPVVAQTPIMPSTMAIHETIDVETLPSRLRVEDAPAPATAAEVEADDEEPQDDETETEESRADDAEEEHAIWTRPAFEVDQFVWPDVCQMMSERAATELAAVADAIWKRAKSGRNTVAVVGNRARQGRTTLTLCLARRLAEMDLRVAVVDGNLSHPAVAGTLGVATQIGWDDAIANHLAVSEAIIESIDDRLTIVPLRSNRSRAIVEQGEKSFPTVTQAVRCRFDVVLVDLAAYSLDRSPPWLQRESGIDWAIVMGDCDAHTDQGIAELARKLADADVKPIGIVEHELLA
jgi:Mrp family chromosome partitioning ATPase